MAAPAVPVPANRDPVFGAAADATPLLYEAVLYPYRSLPPAGFTLLMLALAAVSFVAGIAFVLMGAWPVTGFFGLDVALLYGAFRLSYRSARRVEIIRLAGDELTVERIGTRGERRIWRFHPFWLRLHLVEAADDSNQLVLASHGRRLAVGVFLGPMERRRLASDLQSALDRYRAPPAGLDPVSV